jgi:hypothetical protein
MCRFDTGDLVSFLINFLPIAIVAVAGVIRAGYGWYLLGWLAFSLFFFFVWEARVLCRHCPYWAEEGRVLHCHANHGVIKIWKYEPGPMTTSEQVQFLLGALILVAYPMVFMLVSGEYLLVGICLATVFAGGFNLKRNVCGRCVNFSCPANSVPKPVVDGYLRRNPEMRKAWEATGYRLDD